MTEEGAPSVPETNGAEGVKDFGRAPLPAYCDEDYAGKKYEQSQAIGIRPPELSRRRSKKNKPRPGGVKPSPYAPPSTPPSERVQFLLGQNVQLSDDEDDSRRTYDLFCELSELCCKADDPDCWTWKEIARWVKFEEDVEEGGQRWSKPFVATLSLYSLFEIRKCLVSGSILLDCDATSLQQVADLLIENMVNSGQLKADDRERVRDILLRRHRHQHQKKLKTREGSTKALPLIRSLADMTKKRSEAAAATNSGTGKNNASSPLPHNDSFGSFDPSESSADFKAFKENAAFLKKLPPDAETANVLIGEVDFLENTAVGFVRLTNAVHIEGFTEVRVPTRFIFLLLGPKTEYSKRKYREMGRSMATLMSDEVHRHVSYKARNKHDLLSGLDEFLSNCTVLPPGEWDPSIRIEPPKSIPSQEGRKEGNLPNGAQGANAITRKLDNPEDHIDPTLVRTGRLFGGLIDDIKRKAPFYLSDFRDSFHIQCVASFVYLYFACLTPIITFGGLLGDATDNSMAAMESILAGAICGIAFSLFAGQPLTILGSTGPVLVFETITYHFCEDNKIEYLPFRWWIGLWVMIFLTIMVAFDLSALVRYITRFTEESFASLISLIFIKEAFRKLFHILDTHPFNSNPDWEVDCSCIPGNKTNDSIVMSENVTSIMTLFYNVSDKRSCLDLEGELVGQDCLFEDSIFFFSVLLFFGTFVIAWALKGIKTGRFFPNSVRNIISDFAVVIAIIVMIGLDLLVGLATPKLNVPMKFKPTRDDRGWLISPFGKNEWWTCLAAILPALLAVILIFMDQQITAVIVNRKENKLKKGAGYHLDLLIVGLLIGLCSILGLPWFVAATVLSVTHVMSLKKESETAAPGERPQFLGVREQRVTGVLIFTLIGLSVFFTFILKNISMPILYGVFLFMGISSLKGVQFVHRVLIMFMPAKYQPDYIYLRHVPIRRVHLFTIIQIICLAILWAIKTVKAVSIVFPLMVLAMCFVRKGMDYVFTQHELGWLDDLMPDSKKREVEDQEKEMENNLDGTDGDNQVNDGHVMTISANKISYKPDLSTMNISDEMTETAIWQHLSDNSNDANRRKRRANQDGDDQNRVDGKPRTSIIPEEGRDGRDEDELVLTLSEGSSGEEEKETLLKKATGSYPV